MKKYTTEYYNHLADLYASDYDEACLEDPIFNEEPYDLQFIEYKDSDYEKKRRKIFKKLTTKILDSKFPKTATQVVKLAWHLTEEAKARKRAIYLKLDEIFYVYVLMDPRKPGPWKFMLPGGKTITFPFLPIYIGKGNDDRILDHVKTAKRRPKPVKGERKLNKIRKIHREGFEIIEKKLSDPSVEAIAFAKEILLIKTIGREDTKLGSLTNETDGGEGTSGYTHTEQTKLKIGNSNRGKPGPSFTEEVLARIRKASTGRRHTKEAKESIGLAASLRNSGRKWSPEIVESRAVKLRGKVQQKFECPHCGIIGGNAMKRWHFDNCKFKGEPDEVKQ